MHQPIPDPHQQTVEQPTWLGIALSYVLVVLFPILLWALSDPFNGLLVVIIGAILVVRRRVSSQTG